MPIRSQKDRTEIDETEPQRVELIATSRRLRDLPLGGKVSSSRLGKRSANVLRVDEENIGMRSHG